MKRASNFEGSAIQKQIEAFRGHKPSATPAAETKPEGKAKGKGKAQPAPQPAPDYDSFDDDTPF
jgi:hypothetical protein